MNLLVPDLVTQLITPLEVRPYSAEYDELCTLNSSMPSTLTPFHSRVVAALAVGFGAVQLFTLAIQQPSANAGIAGGPNHSGGQDHESQVGPLVHR